MSGFEVAGVILGAIPLVIAALEHYKSGKSVASALVQWRGHLDTLIHRLRQQDTLFLLSLREHLDIAAVQELSAGRLDLTQEECATIFSFSETEAAMKKSLGSLYGIILETLRRYEECLQKIAGKIRHIQRLDGALKDDLRALIKANPRVNGRFDFKKRLSFAIERGSLKALLEDLREDRLSLGLICNSLKNHQDSSAREVSREAIRIARRLAQVRRRAASLYAALSSGGTACKCKVEHSVMNQLQCRTVKSDLGNATAFSLVVPLGGNDVQPAWATAFLVDMTEEEAEQQRHDGMGTVVTPPKRPAVRFGTPTDKRAVSQQQAQKEKAVKDMCGLAAEALESQRPLRLRLFANALTIQTVATSLPVDMTPFDKVLTVTTLGDALAQAPQQRSGCIWHTPKRQSLLAVDIASSVLQLQRTDWLCAPWSSQTIHFIIGTCAGKEKVGVFIRGDLIGSRTTNVDLTGTVPDTDPHVVVLELAILLLELWHRKSIEAWASSPANGAQLNTSDIDSRHIAVIRWLRATHFSLPVPYLEVIEYCLRVYSGRPQSWDDEQFAQRYCQNIIMPLLQSSKVWPDG